jgi:hypothetical protein
MADTAIVAGVVGLLYESLFRGHKKVGLTVLKPGPGLEAFRHTSNLPLQGHTPWRRSPPRQSCGGIEFRQGLRCTGFQAIGGSRPAHGRAAAAILPPIPALAHQEAASPWRPPRGLARSELAQKQIIKTERRGSKEEPRKIHESYAGRPRLTSGSARKRRAGRQGSRARPFDKPPEDQAVRPSRSRSSRTCRKKLPRPKTRSIRPRPRATRTPTPCIDGSRRLQGGGFAQNLA